VNNYREISINEKYELKYNIVFTNCLFGANNETLIPYIENKKVLVIIDSTVNDLYGEKIRLFLNKYSGVSFLILKVNEYNKNFESVFKVLDAAKNCGLDRKGLMVGIGGGILTDIVGFAASIYRRKIEYLRIPTTLIGQVDAGIGIKTGINFQGSKNLIGSFYPPVACINDISFLATLDGKEIKNGLAEILKMAIMCDMELFRLIEDNYSDLLTTKFQCHVSQEICYRTVKEMIANFKSNFYEKDLKRLVDFGHTFSPFIETYSNYEIPHGCAVALDIALSTEIAFLISKINLADKNRILNLMEKIGLNIYDAETFKPKLIWESLHKILAHRGNVLNMPIPTGIGSAVFINEISLELIDTAVKNLKNRFKEG